MLYLVCVDELDYFVNVVQFDVFCIMIMGVIVLLLLVVIGGMLLGVDFYFDLVWFGVGMYGGLFFVKVQLVVMLGLKVIQMCDVQLGELVGYGYSWMVLCLLWVVMVVVGYVDGLVCVLV